MGHPLLFYLVVFGVGIGSGIPGPENIIYNIVTDCTALADW